MQTGPSKRRALLAGLALVLASCSSMCAFPGTQELPAGTDIHRFDPVAAYPTILAVAGSGYQLRTLDAIYVREDGTQDLAASYIAAEKKEIAKYDFFGPASGRDPSTPIGAAPAEASLPIVNVTISEPRMVGASINGQPHSNYKHLGMLVGRYDSAVKPVAAPTPACSFAKLWTLAKTKGAPAGAVAKISYDSKGYQFTIEGTKVDLRFDTACALVATP